MIRPLCSIGLSEGTTQPGDTMRRLIQALMIVSSMLLAGLGAWPASAQTTSCQLAPVFVLLRDQIGRERVGECTGPPIRNEAGQTFVWTIEAGKLIRRIVMVGRRDEEAGLIEVKTSLPAEAQILASRFDNLKDGAPAIVRAPAAVPVKAG